MGDRDGRGALPIRAHQRRHQQHDRAARRQADRRLHRRDVGARGVRVLFPPGGGGSGQRPGPAASRSDPAGPARSAG
jgi:hypothetical protein